MIINTYGGKEYPLWRYALLYTELKIKLGELSRQHPKQMRIEQIGKSHEDRDLLLVILSDNPSDSGIAEYQKFRDKAFGEPQNIIAGIKAGCDYKIPVFFNANLHGNEISGTDGMIDLIRYILESAEGKEILKDVQVIISICFNPDGRCRGRDIFNGHIFDLNRDWTCQSQPETRAVVSAVLTRFLPTIMLDFHGFMSSNNILIEPCTPPHNPNYEYDLLEGHALHNAQAMAQELSAQLRLKTDIPALVMEDGWEDYPPVCTPQYFMYFGAISHTIETNYPNEEGAAVTYHCARSTLRYAMENKNALLSNQCEYFWRGITGTPLAAPVPKFYIIPSDRGRQKDLSVVRATIDRLLKNKISVYKLKQDNSYVIPTEQPLKGLINTLLWQGEDLNDKVKTMYDVSYYSLPVMSGVTVWGADNLPETANLCLISEADAVEGVFCRATAKSGLRFSSGTGDAMALVNHLLSQGQDVYRCLEGIGECQAGDFIVKDGDIAGLIDHYVRDKDIVVSVTDIPDQLQRVRKPANILIVADSPGSYEVLKAWGFNVTFLPFSELNNGYMIKPEEFDLLIFGGTEAGIWRDVYDDFLGNGYGVSWALRDRGRNLLLEAAGKFANVICFGFAGAKLNQATGHITAGFGYAKGITGDPGGTHSADSQAIVNGSFRLRLNNKNPLCYGYQENETIYAVGPVWFDNIGEGAIAGYYDDKSFVSGFYPHMEEIDNQPALLYRKDARGTAVLLGFDPCFRKYTDFTFRILANAVYLAGSVSDR